MYCVDGVATVRAPYGTEMVAPNKAWSGIDAVTVEARDEPATLLRWDIVARGGDGEPVADDGLTTQEMLAAPVPLPDTECLMRCDRVEFPPGGVAYLHTHRGPGIRCLLTGEITVTVEARSRTIGPLEAWFETGIDPVYARASLTETTTFARVMILPLFIQGKASIRYVNEGDRDKPKPQRYTVLVDRPIACK